MSAIAVPTGVDAKPQCFFEGTDDNEPTDQGVEKTLDLGIWIDLRDCALLSFSGRSIQ